MIRIAPVRVELVTVDGVIAIDLDAARAPATTKAVLDHIDAGGLNGTAFRRVVRADNDNARPTINVVQTMPVPFGPTSPRIPHESTVATGLRHCDGAVSLARSSSGLSSPGAFFVCIGDHPCLDHGGARIADGLGFAAFGHVVIGMDLIRHMHQRATLPPDRENFLTAQTLARPVSIVTASRSSS